MTNMAHAERLHLCDLFLEVGPDAPTLCGDWTTRDLAAHLVIRERRPDAALGIIASPFQAHSEKVRLAAASQRWPDLVEQVRQGPPRWSPQRLTALDQLTNTVEYFVHHEDVRRAQEGWEPRLLDAELDDALWATLRRMGRLLARKAPAGLVAVDAAERRAVVKKGEPDVTVHGPAGELVLFLYGRQAHCRVELAGPPELVEATRTAAFGV
jgi:uncharacterized protein (TIGR03085 family)